jgi:hypothetical protein
MVTRTNLVAALTLAAWIAIGAGAFESFYVTVHFRDLEGLRAFWTEVPYRRLSGLRRMLVAVNERTKPGDRVLLFTPHHPWQNGYGYAFRRAQYVLAGRDVLPLLEHDRDAIDPRSLAEATHIACWRDCPPFVGFDVVWRSDDGMLLRRAR